MSEMDPLQNSLSCEVECLCFDEKRCDIHIDEGGSLVCRHGSNEGVIEGMAKVICPLEIDSERKKWEEFLNKERSESASSEKANKQSKK
jgi:hypothetical protein